MSISSLAGGQSAAQLMRTTFRPPSFESLDSNADSSLSLDEFKLGAPKGAQGANADKRAEALFKAMDADGDGSVTGTEKDMFDTAMVEQRQSMAFMAQQIAGPSNADIFANTDTDGDGAVTIEEFGNDEAATDIGSEALQKLFDLVDADGDGSITETESSDFLDAIQSALNENRPAGPPPGGLPPGPPPAEESDEASSEDGGTTLLSLAQNAYKTSQQQSLLKQLVSIFDTAA